MAKKNKIDSKYYLLESETVKFNGNHQNSTESSSIAPDELTVRDKLIIKKKKI